MTLSPEVLGRRAGQALLTFTAVVGVLCAVATVGALVFGVHPVIVRSGSMTPAISTGSIAFGHDVPASSLHVGDIVTVPSGDSSVTHRIVDITPRADGKSVLELKGDANNRPDGQVHTVASAKRLLFSVPEAGFVVAWLSKAPGSYVLATYVVAMLMLVGRRRETPGGPDATIADAPEPEPTTVVPVSPASGARRGPFAVVTAGALLALGIAVVSGWGQSSWALWSDAASSTGTTIATGTYGPPAAPVVTCGTLGKKLVRVNWTAVPGATGYDLYYPNATTLQATNQNITTFDLVTTNQSGTFQIKARNASGTSAFSNSLTYDVGNGSNNGTCS